MGRLSFGKLRGSALIEAIVASTIFLIVSMLSLETVSRITTGGGADEWVLVEADHRADACFAKYGAGEYSDGTYEDEFAWGRITTEISGYRDYPDLQEIVISATINNSRRTIIYRHIIERKDD